VNKYLLRANDELVDYFTASIGVRAGDLQPKTTGGEVDFVDGMVREIDLASRHDRRTSIAKHDLVRATLAATPAEARRVLELVYTPFGTGFTPAKRTKKKADADVAPDFLATALTPDEGGGSYVRLALTMPRTKRTYEKQYPDKPVPDVGALLVFLQFTAGKGADSAPFFAALRDDCDGPRMSALRAYDDVRKLRRAEEKLDDERRAVRKKRNADAHFRRLLRGEAYE